MSDLQPVTYAQRLFTIPKHVVSFFYFDSDGDDEYYLSRDCFVGYANLERTLYCTRYPT